jgi:hypothetical protein
MSLNINNEETHQLATQLAQLTGCGIDADRATLCLPPDSG